ncbi:MAG: hypothetical protein Kow00129_08830 [Thermoleophilia bacterium]
MQAKPATNLGEARGSRSEIGGIEEADESQSAETRRARLAVYASESGPPEIHDLSAPDSLTLISRLADETTRLSRLLGGRIPPHACRAVIENLLHADLRDVTVTIADRGNLIRVSDRGPGITEKERALRVGFTTADSSLRSLIPGVGSGLSLARRSLEALGGTLTIEDNLDFGCVVTLELPPTIETLPPGQAAARDLTERQLRVLLMVVELQPVGPTALAADLNLSPATAYRELVRLERLGLVTSDEAGHRSMTEAGMAHIESLF